MPRWRQWRWRLTALAVALVLISGLAYVSRQHSEARRMEIVEANNVKALAMKAAIEHRFPLGTPESQIVEFLRKEHPNFQTMGTPVKSEYWVPVGKEPSGVWYCGSFTAYVALEFSGERFAGAQLTRWSADCL